MEPTDALLALQRGAEQLARGERRTAWQTTRAAVNAAPRDGLVQVLGSRLLFLVGDQRAALAASEAAAQLGVESAVMLRFEQAREIGWFHAARAMLEQILRAGRRTPQSPLTGAAERDDFDRALGYLVQLYVDAQHFEGAAAILSAFLPMARPSVSLFLQAARIHERRQAIEPAMEAIRRALAAEVPTATTRQEAAALLLRLGAFDDARALYEGLLADPAVAPHALEALARLCLWHGDRDGALAHADQLRARDPGSASARRIAAAVQVMRRAPADALTLLDAVLRESPNDAEAYAWRAEARLRLGHRQDAQADAQRSPPGSSHSFAARALNVLASLPSPDDSRPTAASQRLGQLNPARWLRRAGDSPAPPAQPAGIIGHARHELAAELTAIDADAPRILASQDERAVAALLERALQAMRGNRTPLATYVGDNGRLQRLPVSTSARVASRLALELIKVASPEETLKHFDALVAQRPDSAMPLVHRGELRLWLGNYAEARADLEGAIAVHRQTRWAWYGLACLDLLGGEPQRALETCAYGIRVMDNTEGPVAFSYRGEAYRLLGRLEEARDQLRSACELHPRRISAWINLALVYGAAGDDHAQRTVFQRLASDAPMLLAAAASDLGDDLFERVVLDGPAFGAHTSPDPHTIDRLLGHALVMMRGNRSSSCITFFTADGHLRHVPQGQRDDPTRTTRLLSRIQQVLSRAVETRRRPQEHPAGRS